MKQLLSILILFCAFSGIAQYGVLVFPDDHQYDLINFKLYRDSVLIPKEETLFEFSDDYSSGYYDDEFYYDSLIPGLYSLYLTVGKEKSETNIDIYGSYEINFKFDFLIKPDTLTRIEYDSYSYNQIYYTPILERLYSDSTQLQEFLKSRTKSGPEFSIYFANRNWNPNSSQTVSLIGGRMGGIGQINFNRYFAGSIYGGIDLIYGLFNESKTALSNSTQLVKHQNYIQSNLKFETAFHFQYPDKSYKKPHNPFAIKLGLGYNLPIRL